MAAGANTQSPLAHDRPSVQAADRSPKSTSAGQNLLFKKRKLLPHPRAQDLTVGRSASVNATPMYDTAPVSAARRIYGSPSPSPTRPVEHTLKHHPDSVGAGLDLPPTPPAHSRKSSSSHSAMPSTPPFVDTPDTSTEDVQQARVLASSPTTTPKTPTNQTSPPTPDVTPPELNVEKRPRAMRPPPCDRLPSKATTIGSQADSFKTAPENPDLSEEDEGRSVLRPVVSSVRTSSQSTVRQTNGDAKETRKKPRTIGLGLGLESSPETSPEPSPVTPKSMSIEKHRVINGHLESDQGGAAQRSTTPKKQASAMDSHRRQEVLEDNVVAPAKATEILRTMRLPDRPRSMTLPSPQGTPQVKFRGPSYAVLARSTPRQSTSALGQLPDRQKSHVMRNNSARHSSRQSAPALGSSPELPSRFLPQQPASNGTSSEVKSRRSSALSSKSTISTATVAASVDNTPQRQKTLRHVRKLDALRDSSTDLSQPSPSPTSVQQTNGPPRRPRLNGQMLEKRPESYSSVTTNNSISSRKARREVWKNGGIPVVIVPERRSSIKSTSRTPSLRSTRSSALSKRSQSVSSSQRYSMGGGSSQRYPPLTQLPKGIDFTPYFDRPARRGRAMSTPDGSQPGDQRTMDYPPVVPVRTSSLSAPTSRSTSRAASLTADSLRSLDRLQSQASSRPPLKSAFKSPESQSSGQGGSSRRSEPRPEIRVGQTSSPESVKGSRQHPVHRVSVDHHGDPLFGRRLSAQQTPFSQYSMETSATSNAEVSEAQAVSLHPHQNTSVLMVNHSNRPSESSESSLPTAQMQPSIKTTDTDAGTGPVTPPQPGYSMDDVDSPLRNPRQPPLPPSIRPIPPVIEFIPATPSGLTPAQEKSSQLGNFYEEEPERPPMPRRMSTVVRRALGRRENSTRGISTTDSSRSSRGLLSRTLSLTRSSTLRRYFRDASDRDVVNRDETGRLSDLMYPDDEPADETRLHPFWRPANAVDDSDHSSEDEDYEEERWTYRYPPIDNRPSSRSRRTLSQRVKKTFAILPSREDYYGSGYMDDFPLGRSSPIRRTVHRSTSGNLRVVKHRASLDSISRPPPAGSSRPFTAPDDPGNDSRRSSGLWRPLSQRQPLPVVGGGDGGAMLPRRRLSLKLDRLTRLHGLPRRLSERRRERRSMELRRTISGPRELRDGVDDVIRRSSNRGMRTRAG